MNTHAVNAPIQSRIMMIGLAVMSLVCLMQLAGSYAAIPLKTVAHYRVSTRGFSIGEVQTTQRISDEGGINRIHFETKTAVKASFLWMGYHLSSTEKGILQDGTLVSYSHKGQENGTTIDVEGRLDAASFRFEVREHGTTRTVLIPRSSYDCTTMECPEARLDFSDKKPVALKILDVEKMAVVKRDYRLVSSVYYAVDGKEYPCRIVDFSDLNKKARRWITWDGSAVVMFRQDGTGERNSYSVQAISVKKEM
jgi:hypothetical protein